MRDPLSIRDAARDRADAPALSVADETLTFGDLAELVRNRTRTLALRAPHAGAYPLIADNTLDSLLTLYALLEQRVPALVIDPRLTALERDALIADASEAPGVRHADAAAIVHTSGTTGKPRGAVLTRSALVASAAASASNLGWRDDDCWLACMPIARVGGLSIVTRCLIARRRVALERQFDVDRVPAWIERYRASLVSLVPTMLTRLLDTHASWRAPAHVRAVLVGGAAAPRSVLRRARERGIPIVLTYGLTESCAQVVATPYERRFEANELGAGMPLRGAEVRAAQGRIEVKGPMVMSGYWNEPPRSPDAWLDTGDIGELDAQGCLHVLGRRTDVIVAGGDNVHPAEVERVLEDHPDIEAAAVFGVANETWGQTVAAALVAKRTPPADADLEAWIAARLAPYKRPRRVCFVERLPQTPQGKLDRTALHRLEPSLRPLKVTAVLHR